MGDVTGKLIENSDHVRESLERQRKAAENENADTVRLEQVRLETVRARDTEVSPLERILPETAARARALEASAADRTNKQQQESAIPNPYDHRPGGPKAPSIQGLDGMFSGGPIPRQGQAENTPEKHLSAKTISSAELDKMNSEKPLPHERLAAKVDRGDLFDVAKARVAAAQEIEKLRPRVDGSRSFAVESRTR